MEACVGVKSGAGQDRVRRERVTVFGARWREMEGWIDGKRWR